MSDQWLAKRGLGQVGHEPVHEVQSFHRNGNVVIPSIQIRQFSKSSEIDAGYCPPADSGSIYKCAITVTKLNRRSVVRNRYRHPRADLSAGNAQRRRRVMTSATLISCEV